MKRTLAAGFFAIWVAATLFAQQRENPPYGTYDFGNGLTGLWTIEDFNLAMTHAKNQIENIQSAALQQKAKIDTLWTEASNLVNGLKSDAVTLADLVKRDSEGNGFLTNNDFDEWIEDYKEDYKSTTKSLGEKANYSDLSPIKSLIANTGETIHALKDKVLDHDARIESLEKRPIGGGGAGCGDDCKESLRNLATFLGDSLSVADGGTTGSCVTVTASGTLFDSVLNKLPVCYYGSAFEVGSSAPVQIFEDAELTMPAFGAADIWAGEGLEAALPTGHTVKKQLNVKVKNPADFTAKSLGQMLDGDTSEQNSDGVAYADVSGVAAVDGEGHLRQISVGSISLAVDGNTIVREKKDDSEDAPLVLKAKIANMVDGSTITTDGEGGAAKAKVKVDALCDNDTIGVNASNKLCVKKSGIKIVGTDGVSNWPDGDTDTPAQTITFKSASDSNVKVTVSGSKDNATVTIGVYYK